LYFTINKILGKYKKGFSVLKYPKSLIFLYISKYIKVEYQLSDIATSGTVFGNV